LHFNNAGASLMPQPILDAMVGYLREEATIGGYEAARTYHAQLERFYGAMAQLLNADPDEIAYVENATRAWDMVFYSLKFERGDKIVTANSEYASNYIALLQVQKNDGVEVVVIPDDAYGQIDLVALEAAMDERVKLIALTHIPSTGGLVNPAEKVGEIARKHNVLYLLDACQSVGQRVVDVQAIGCDFLSGTGRKFLRGARGTGFLYVKKERIADIEPMLLDLHSAEWTSRTTYTVREDARRFENWEQNYAGKLALGMAADYALNIGMANIQERVQFLANELRLALGALPNVAVHDVGVEKSGIVTFAMAGADHYAIRDRLAERRMNVSISPKEYSRLDFENRNLNTLIRASVHYYNTEDEIERFVETIQTLGD
jgi:selenocysteine lyase/cysteine desulfurase